MNTREIAQEYRQSHWAQIMRDRRESELSIKAYCERTGITENAYYYWLRKLRETACEGLRAVQGSPQPARLSPSVFTEVKLSDQPDFPEAAIMGRSYVCVEAAGIRLTAGSEYPVEKLTELVGGVMRACC